MTPEDAVRALIRHIGEEPSREGLQETPARVSKSLREMTRGYGDDPQKLLSKQFDADGYDQIVALRDISFVSLCEHHLLPFIGKAHVAYIPVNRVVGLSKLARVVHCFARRLQIQERMTRQVADAVQQALDPVGVAVVVDAHHACMGCRGVGDAGTVMTTSALTGAFMDKDAARSEVLMILLKGGTA